MFCNWAYLINIQATARPTTSHCNADLKVCTNEGIFSTELFGEIPVKYNPSGICNMISLKSMKSLFPITYHSNPNDDERAMFNVHTTKGIIEFWSCSKRLHCYNLANTAQPAKILSKPCSKTSKDFPRIRRNVPSRQETTRDDGKSCQSQFQRDGA